MFNQVMGVPGSSSQSRAALLTARSIAVAVSFSRFVLGMFIFITALQIMKAGAADLDFWNQGIATSTPMFTFGMGWFAALTVLSGSPIAASSLTLVAGGSLSEMAGFAMLTGSRLGAAFVVLFVAVIYSLRGERGKRGRTVSIGIMALCVTALQYVPGGILGLFLIKAKFFDAVTLNSPAAFLGAMDLVYGGLLQRLQDVPSPMVFLGGLAVLLSALKVIDGMVPKISEETLHSARANWLRRKWPMFFIGCAVALVTMSVSVALTVLVPLISKRYVQRSEVVPYIMGANIATLGDTLLAAFLIDSAVAVRIVLTSMVGTTGVSIMVLTLLYHPLQDLISRMQRWMTQSRTHMAGFTAALFIIPLACMGMAVWGA